MTEQNSKENYPFWIVVVSNLLSLSIYGLGFSIMLKAHWILSVLYLVYIAILEFRLLKNSCVDCYYWGKVCGFGKGRISSLLFRKGDISNFCTHEISWKDMIPDILVPLIPFITGIVLLFAGFDIFLLSSMILLALLASSGNGFIRTKLTCRYCKQKESGCPADILFNKNKTRTAN